MTNHPSTLTAENRHAEDLLALCQPLFANLLLADSRQDDTWAHRLETLNRCQLLTYRVPSIFKPKPLAIDENRLDDSRYRRWLSKKLVAPRPGKFMNVRLDIDRTKLTEPAYRQDISTVLAHKWMNQFLPVESLLDVCVLTRLLTVSTLRHCLDNLRLNDLYSKRVVPTLMRQLAEELVDNNEDFQRCMAEMRCATGVIVAEAQAAIRTSASEILESGNAAIDEITADGAARFDALSAEISQSFAESAARNQIALDECATSGEDPEVEFRRALDQRERERKEAYKNSKEKWIWRAGLTAFALVVTFFFEIGVDHITPAEAIVDFARWLGSALD